MLQPGPAAWVRRYSDAYYEREAAHPLDADREEILAGIGDEARSPSSPSAPPFEAPADGPLPLAGLRILDTGNVIAGPTVGSVLARFGAECIKVDKPFPEYDPGLSVLYALHCNRGKRSMLLDLTRSDGREVLTKLVATSDVVVYNGSDRQLEKLGLDLASLAATNPSIVLCLASAYGGPRQGPKSGHPGYDECAQSLTGISVRNGGSLATAEEISPVGCLDHLCGFLGAYAVLLGLIERSRCEGPVQVGTSLSATAQLVQLPFMYEEDDRLPFDEPCGPDAQGEHALYRLYRTNDGWLFLGAKRDQMASLRRLAEFADLPEIALDLIGDGPSAARGAAAIREDRKLMQRLEAGFALRPAGEWVRELTALGIGACVVRSYDQVRAANLVRESDAGSRLNGDQGLAGPLFVRHESHPSGHVIDLVAPTAIRMQHCRTVAPGAAPKFGAHTCELLREQGLTDGQVQELLANGTARESLGDQYLPD